MLTLPLPRRPFRFPQIHASNPVLCTLELADYKECLHRDKLKRRIAAKLVEHQEQAHPAPAHGHAAGAH